MFDIIEELRKKPEHKRKIFAVSVSFVVTAIIFIIWLSTVLPTSPGKNVATDGSGANDASSVRSTKEKEIGPFTTFKQQFGTAFASLKSQLGEVKQSLNSVVY